MSTISSFIESSLLFKYFVSLYFAVEDSFQTIRHIPNNHRVGDLIQELYFRKPLIWQVSFLQESLQCSQESDRVFPQ